jgi:t-SNARE complex subunit (syntaxin)
VKNITSNVIDIAARKKKAYIIIIIIIIIIIYLFTKFSSVLYM